MLTFSATAISELLVQLDEGQISLRGCDGTTLEARLDFSGDLDYDDVVFRQQDGRVELKVDDEGDLEMEVPRNVKVTLVTGDGHIEVDAFDGSLDARTDDGDIEARGRFDSLHLTTDDGHIEVEADQGSQMSGPWSVRTDDGDIVLRLPGGFAADLDVTAHDGEVRVDLPFSNGKLNGGGQLLTVHAGDGDVRVRSA